MRRIDNPELKRRILNHLAAQYRINEVREPNHLSSYIGCRTKTFLQQKQTTECTDEEVMLFALGYGLQEVITPKGAVQPIYERDGVIYRPDMSFTDSATFIEQLMEVKTTRKSAKYHYVDEHIPNTWLMYMKGGCYIRGTVQYDLIVLYMMGNYSPPFPCIYADTFVFDKIEIEANWQIIMKNKEVLDKALKEGQPPTPFENCFDFECKYCRFNMVCKAIVMVNSNSKQDKTLQQDKDMWG